jgi:hypothetical protein
MPHQMPPALNPLGAHTPPETSFMPVILTEKKGKVSSLTVMFYGRNLQNIGKFLVNS